MRHPVFFSPALESLGFVYNPYAPIIYLRVRDMLRACVRVSMAVR